MKSAFRTATVAWTVVGILLCTAYSPSAQEAEQPEDALVTHEYDVRGLVQRELWRAPRTGAIGDVLAPDRLFFNDDDHADDEWSLRESGEEARCWDDADELGDELQEFLTNADNEVEIDYFSADRTISFRATPQVHERIKWLLDALNDVANARVSMVVYRLTNEAELTAPTMGASDVAGWAKGAKLVGTFRGGLGEPFVLQKTQHTSYVADYEINLATEAAVSSPEVNDLNTGEEFVLGAASLSDGRLWVQGWHASMKLNEMRQFETSAGTVELPDLSYSFAPVSAVIENGGAAVIDAGPAGRFMVRTKCDRVVKNRELKLDNGNTLRLLNCIGAMRGAGLGGFWLMNPTSSALMEDSLFPQVMLGDVIDGPYMDAAMKIADELEGNGIELEVMGPYLGVIAESGEDFDDDDLRELHEITARLAATPAAPETASVRITAYSVADDSDLPAGILNGRPDAADLAEVESLASKTLFDRVSMNLLRQQVDQFEVRLATHLRAYDSCTATGVTALDPQVGTIVLGEQIRWQARDAGDGRMRIEVRTGITVGCEFEQVNVGTDGLFVERSRSALTQARLADELKIGERMSSLSPGVGVDGELVVIVVERLK